MAANVKIFTLHREDKIDDNNNNNMCRDMIFFRSGRMPCISPAEVYIIKMFRVG